MHKSIGTLNIFVLVFFSLLSLPSCRGRSETVSGGMPVEMRYASNLTIDEYEGYSVVKIRNPWDSTRLLQSYVLLEDGYEPPSDFNREQIIRVPLKKSVVYSAVHVSLLDELEAEDAISGVCDSEYIYEPGIKQRIASGVIADCGNSMAPNMEKILLVAPGAVLLSPFENSNGHGKLDQAGIPVVECADYMETSPLGRAEWMKFYGRLFGMEERADSMFQETERQYLELKKLASGTVSRPKVLFDRIYGQSWNLPAGRSTMGILVKDAGGLNPYEDVEKAGSLQLSPEKVLYDAGDADIWLIRFAYTPVTMKSLSEDNGIYTKFKAYRENNIYGSDSSRTRIFEDVAFHPQWLLSFYIRLFHPELDLKDEGRQYFEKIN